MRQVTTKTAAKQKLKNSAKKLMRMFYEVRGFKRKSKTISKLKD